MTVTIMTLSLTTLSILFSIKTLSNITYTINDYEHIDTQQKDSITTISTLIFFIMTLSIILHSKTVLTITLKTATPNTN
jgi:hypothetical protein